MLVLIDVVLGALALVVAVLATGPSIRRHAITWWDGRRERRQAIYREAEAEPQVVADPIAVRSEWAQLEWAVANQGLSGLGVQPAPEARSPRPGGSHATIDLANWELVILVALLFIALAIAVRIDTLSRLT